MEFPTKVLANGHIVIPKNFRDYYDVQPGDKVFVHIDTQKEKDHNKRTLEDGFNPSGFIPSKVD